MRRSAGHAEKCIEYFVPRSLSEFNLSGMAGDLYDLSFDRGKSQEGKASGGKPRDKMVTFEDDRPSKTLADDVFM